MPRISAKSKRQSALKRWKTTNEKEILESYFELDNNWGKKTINYVKDLVELSEEQIYKWGYEKRKISTSCKDKRLSATAQISKIEENFLNKSLDYNSIVSDLFPESEVENEKLTKEEKAKYDQLRDQILKKSADLKNMSELDQILLERLPVPKISLNKKAPSCRKSTIDEHSTLNEGFVREEVAKRCQEEPVHSFFESQLENSRILNQGEEYQFPKIDSNEYDYLRMEENVNFGELPNGIFNSSNIFGDESQNRLFQL
ncbi:unnamed protein product [Moneuplotes crassus]|uniref:Uncharacterized protein n=1 Tax=Euplotes crassus TaxID=5936 RepID=A0AAD1X5I2_EUPCR|nr:unnamed protein product [Moneuplotes crassus]